MKISGTGSLRIAAIFIAVALAVCPASMCFADVITTWDLQADFSTTANPSGEWTYGVYLEDAIKPDYGPFYTWPAFASWAELSNLGYYGNPGNDLGAGVIFYNPSDVDLYSPGSDQFLRAKQVALHPAGSGWGYAPVVRWTAPRDMTVTINAEFAGQDNWTTTDAHVLLNGYMNDGPIFQGTHLFDGIVDGNVGCVDLGISQYGASPVQTYSGQVTLTAGDTIDFVVGYGENAWYGADLTRVSATIVEVPEPSTFVAIAVGLLCFLGWRKRK